MKNKAVVTLATVSMCVLTTGMGLSSKAEAIEREMKPVIVSVASEKAIKASRAMPIDESEPYIEEQFGNTRPVIETSSIEDELTIVNIDLEDSTLELGLYSEYEQTNLQTIECSLSEPVIVSDKPSEIGGVSVKDIDAKVIELEKLKQEEIERKKKEEAERKAEEERKKKEQERLAKLEEARRAEVGTILDVPDVRSNFKAFMDYRCITSKTSKQWELQHNGKAYTNEEGFRMYDGEYMVAVGSYYSQKIGTRLRVVLDNGNEFYCVVGDHKSDLHTDEMHQHRNGNVVEFIVEQDKIPEACKKTGDMSNATNASLIGKVKYIEKLASIEE